MGGIRSYVDYSKVVLDEPTERYLATKKKSTAETYRGNLKRLQKYLDKPLGQWITEIEEQQKENEDLPLVERKRPGENDIRGFIEWMKENGYGSNPIRNSLTATQNMFKYYSIKMSFAFIEIPPPIRRKGNSKQEWTLNKLKKFVEAAPTYRDKAIIVVMLQTGMAVNEISNLNYGDVKRQLENDELPVLIKLVREKNSNSFKTLMGADAVKYLRLYLDTRGKLSDNDPLFTKWGTEDRITDGSIANRFREIVKDLDFIEIKRGKMNPARPHSLRAAFKSRLTGKTDTDLIKFWMGNVLGPKSTAYLNLPDEEHVKLYMSIEKY
ncbi:MAG: tyrosine-type recombinase/integrase, partial [Candidatus Bathyarchaeota archaeon]|nr:tyrosine-type recombinase/integrase [Candidatus Bathyarchaeota archaeon]